MNVLKGKVITKILDILVREEKGLALPLALAMLAVGSIIVVPLLNLTETALRSGIQEENRMYEHYAANAGIMDGLREIIADNPLLPGAGDNWTYSIPDTNDRTVNVIISRIDQSDWGITGTATSNNGDSTEINCYVEEKHYSPNAITATSVTIKPAATVQGTVQFDSTLGSLINNGEIIGEIIDRPIDWPSAEEVNAFYLEQVDGAPTYEGNLVLNLLPDTIGNPYSLGPIYINGDLNISAPSSGAFRLDGTVYVTGSVIINTGVKMYQNGKHIYADGTAGIKLLVGSSAYEGGGIIARYGINYFCSTISSSYTIVWSLKGWVSCNPAGQFYGMLYCGELNTTGKVTVENGKIINYVEPSPDLLIGPLPGRLFKIVGWESDSN